MLLRFRVTNHRSIRDTVELVLAKSTFEGAKPSDGNWKSVTNRVVGIFGSNASGKTNLLNAASFAQKAINSSAEWGDRTKFPYRPFVLDGHSPSETSAYEFDFIMGGTRYIYGFESNSTGIQGEWLHSFPEGRRRVLFERTGPSFESITFGRNLKGENVRIARRMGAMNLYLSIAAESGHKELRRVHYYLDRHIEYAAYSESQQQNRIRFIKRWMETDKIRRRAESLLKFADLGISRLSVEDVPMDEEKLRIIASITKMLTENLPQQSAASGKTADELVEEVADDQRRRIKFWHKGDGRNDGFVLEIENESSGTVAWLSLALPAMRAIENGLTFVVDEIDASLHPRLTAAFISLFKDPEINVLGAQLIFASHDTSLMGHLAGGALEKEDVWFAEKAADGASEYYPLTDFPVKADHNLERRYLSGRYGAVPAVSWEDLRASLVAGVHE
ncbi:ATP-binding protein [Streptomyces sp. V4-01]|uniref:ATP-binding protein n=1 Tax=Actinacidiphila polyblastidii TaxID=3110430 RepID=A0ABU7P803_9ACTN|nr:ATP-binding protein [Streptomyces sp. V4-01]